MRKRKSVLKPLAAIFTVMFLLNMAVMRVFFNINVIGVKVRQEVKHVDIARSSLSSIENETDGEDEAEAQMESTTEAGTTDQDPASSIYAVSPGTVASLQHLSVTDKLLALSILSKMGTEEIDRIFELSNDGITFDEYEELKRSMENRLNPSDVVALKKIIDENQELIAQDPGK